jgi:hypothetical protein
MPVVARSKTWSSAARLLELRDRNPPGHGCLSVVSVVCCQVEIFWRADPSSRGVCGVQMSMIEETQGGGLSLQGLTGYDRNRFY